MTSPPKPPARRRRRAVFTIIVLAFASLFAWWFWPRGDARFVGKWEWWVEEHTAPELLITLHRYGTAEITDLRAATPSTTKTWWRVKYNCLCFGFDRRSDWYDEMAQGADLLKGVFRLDFEPIGHGHLILDAEHPDEIRLSTWMILNGDPNILLRRRRK
jgi:hypothetical protein